MNNERKIEKIPGLLAAHEHAIIKELGASAFDILTPQETASIIGMSSKRIPDLNREGWLEPVPGKDIGPAHQYYRWRAIFVQRYRKTRQKRTQTHPT